MDPNYLEVFDARLPDGDLGGSHGWQKIACVSRYPSPGGQFPGPKFSVGWLRGHVHSVYNFLDSIANQYPPRPSLQEGLHLQRILETVRESADKQQWVPLPQMK
jgi:predicted dehydrogenase